MSTPTDIAHGARLLAIETAIRALIDQVSTDDPTLRDRIRSAAEAYLATIPLSSELERDFAERSRDFVEAIVKPPAV